MSAKKLTVTEVARNFSEILGRVRFKGERFILLKGGKPVAELRPAKGPAHLRLKDLPEVLAALPHLGADDADRFARDLESARVAVGLAPAAPWES
jgi:antitoxin (DNA-binding transcriptional repressor) of toxin-antitoxin stability system